MNLKPDFESSWGLQLLCKSMPFFFAAAFVLLGAAILLGIKDVDGNRLPVEAGLSFLFVGAGFSILAWAVQKKFGKARFYPETIEIEQAGSKASLGWKDVRSIVKVPFTTPPVYRMSYLDKGRRPTYFLFQSRFYATLLIYSYDFTGFPDYARKKMTEKQIPS